MGFLHKWAGRLLIEEKGAVTVLLAAALVVLTGFTALVTDIGLLYLTRSRMVDALDSAVLAGVQELPANPDNALNMADTYAAMNGLAANECSFTIEDDNTIISGDAERDVNFLFARVLGHYQTDVKVHARARISPVSALCGVAPFGVLEDNYNFGQEIVLKQGGGESLYSGWFGALGLGGNGANVYEKNVKYGYDGKIAIGDIIPVESGNMSGPTKKGINYRIQNCNHSPQCSINSYVEGCPRIIKVPVIRIENINQGGHPSEVRVIGFAAFFIDEYVGNGNENAVRGAFIHYVIPGETDEDAPDLGLYTTQLIE